MASLEGWSEVVGLVLRASVKTGFAPTRDRNGLDFCGNRAQFGGAESTAAVLTAPAIGAAEEQARKVAPSVAHVKCAYSQFGPARRAPSRETTCALPEAPRRAAPTASGAAAALQHKMASMMLRMIGLGPKKAKKKKSRRATLGAVPEYQKETRKPPTRDGRTPLGAIQEHREVPKARKVRRSMRRHSLGAMPLSPDEKTPPRKRSPVKKNAPPKWEHFARGKGISPRPKASPPPPGTPAEVRRLRKRVSELEQTIAFRDKSLDDIEAELLAAYASLLAAADLGYETSKYEARVEELSTAATEHPERALRDQELRRAFVDEEINGPASEALALVRGLVPSDLSSGGSVSVERLVDAGLPVKVAHRVSRTRALWLTRVHPDEIAKMHASDLVNTRATVTLDLVEARAVWRQCLRAPFADHDSDGRKRAWFEELERRVRTLVAKEAEGDLSPKDSCHPAYDKFRC
jgi:hypothetical protein